MSFVHKNIEFDYLTWKMKEIIFYDFLHNGNDGLPFITTFINNNNFN